MTFEQWMRQVDLAIQRKAGVSADDLADQPYRDWFDDEMSPGEAASQALEDEGFEE